MRARKLTRPLPDLSRCGTVVNESRRALESMSPGQSAQIDSVKPTTLLVMDAELLSAVSLRLRMNVAIPAVSMTLHMARRKLAEGSLSLVISGITLPDGTWCDIARAIGELKRDIRLLVAKTRGGEVLLADVVRRAGYFALPAPHRWVSAEKLI